MSCRVRTFGDGQAVASYSVLKLAGMHESWRSNEATVQMWCRVRTFGDGQAIASYRVASH